MKKRNWSFLPIVLTVLCLSACASKPAKLSETAADHAKTNMQAVNEQTVELADDSKTLEATEKENNYTPQTGRKLIRNVTLNLETDTFDSLIPSLQADINRLGGYVEQSDISGNSLTSHKKPHQRYASITARIPVNQLDSFLKTVDTTSNVTYKSESTQDVTLQYNDLESRKKSLIIEQEKMWGFLEKADSPETVITLEKRLSEIRYELESMESQLKLYDNQVDYSTVDLSIHEVTTFTPSGSESTLTRIQKGLTGNFKLFGTAMVNCFIGIITTLPFWFPIAFIIGFLISFLRKRKAKKQMPLPEPKEEK